MNPQPTPHSRSAAAGSASRLPLIVLIAGLFAGCATAPIQSTDQTTLSKFREPLGTIGILPQHPSPELRLQMPLSKSQAAGEAARKTAFGVLTEVAEDGGGGDPRGVAVVVGIGIAWMPVGALVGSTFGVIRGLPAREFVPAVNTMTKARSQFNLSEELIVRVLTKARQSTGHTINLLTNDTARLYHAPSSSVRGMVYTETANGTVTSVVGLTEAKPPPEIGAEVILVFCWVIHALQGEEEINPLLAVEMKVQCSLVRADDGTTIHFFDATHRSDKKKFAQWAAADARPFRDEVSQGLNDLAGQIAGQLSRFQPKEAGRGPGSKPEPPPREIGFGDAANDFIN